MKTFLMGMGALVLLGVIGIGSCAYWGYSKSQEAGEYAAAQLKNYDYQTDVETMIARLDRALDLNHDASDFSLNNEVLAIYVAAPDNPFDSIEIYKKHRIQSDSKIMPGSWGTGTMDYGEGQVPCIVGRFEHDYQTYSVFFLDQSAY